MAGGNKKKKKPAANPARRMLYATTSTQSKSKIENAVTEESATTSESATATRSPDEESSNPSEDAVKTETKDLSPEELEAQLEAAELQQFIESHAAKVKKEASRQVSKLRTEKRLLRGQADYLSVKSWLPEEIMQQLLDATSADLEYDRQTGKRNTRPVGDDLVAKVWTLRLILIDIDVSFERANAAIEALLQYPPAEDASLPWGLSAALDWLALNSEEMLEYDAPQKSTALKGVEAKDENTSDQSETEKPVAAPKHDSPHSEPVGNQNESAEQSSADVSDVESDAEPDELLAAYLRCKARLYKLNPDAKDATQKKGNKKASQLPTNSLGSDTVYEKKLRDKLKKIESDVLFDQRGADAQWAEQRNSLAKEAAQRKRLNLEVQPPAAMTNWTYENATARTKPNKEVNAAEDESDDSDGDFIGGMFDALPGVSQSQDNDDPARSGETIIIRDFGRVTGMSPRRILEETARSRDSRCTITYQQVSPTTYSCRHRVTIDWASEQEVLEHEYAQSVLVKTTPRRLTVTMIKEATPDVSQSESCVATVAMFLVFSASPKEEKAHLRLPPAFRDLWDELAQQKREYLDARDCETVKKLRKLIEQNPTTDPDSDDEVVFNAASRRLNGNNSGTSTPPTRPQTPKPNTAESQQLFKEIWSRKTSVPSYHRMLAIRMNLPMFHAKANILPAIEKNQITIVVGDTGSGKSTQLPQFILENELSNGRACKIYCTQPRRISALSLAQRVSEELGEFKNDLGTARSLVGYAIRLESHINPQTRLVYATVGIVLRMLEGQDGLGDITHLVLDEVHERNIDTDFLLIVARSLLASRPDLKIVLMSATVDAEKFSRYLDGAPIISVPGRTFPVRPYFLEDAIELTGYTGDGTATEPTEDAYDADAEPRNDPRAPQMLDGYKPLTKEMLKSYDEYKIDYGLIIALLETIAHNPHYMPFSQAILIFVPGIQEIRRLNDTLQGHASFRQNWRIHALHSTFSSEDQQAAFDIPPPGMRKIVIATNIAETGITIPDVTCVIDTGKHREMRFDERRQMSRLTQSFIAKANAKQRRGRAGRVQEGICFHLFTRDRFENLMAEQQTPEMLRLSLQDLVMRVKICKLGDIESTLSEALDPPSSKNVRRAIDALIEVGALTTTQQLTALGSQLAKLPLDAQLGKLVLYGAAFGCLDFTLTVAAALSSKSPFLAPMYAKKQADTVRLGFARGESDLLTLYNAYSAWRKVCTTPGLSEYQFCNKNFLSAPNLANIEDLKAQLLMSLVDANIVTLDPSEKQALTKVRPGSRQRNFVTLPSRYTTTSASDTTTHDTLAASLTAWSFYPRIIKKDGKGWRNIANNQSLALHPTSVNKTRGRLSPDTQYLSFYSIMQSSAGARFTNAQETTAVPDFALALLASADVVWNVYAGVVVVDGNRLKMKVRDWRAAVVVKILRGKIRGVLERGWRSPGRVSGERQRRWVGILERVFEKRS